MLAGEGGRHRYDPRESTTAEANWGSGGGGSRSLHPVPASKSAVSPAQPSAGLPKPVGVKHDAWKQLPVFNHIIGSGFQLHFLQKQSLGEFARPWGSPGLCDPLEAGTGCKYVQ